MCLFGITIRRLVVNVERAVLVECWGLKPDCGRWWGAVDVRYGIEG